jgi:glycosyltransferase involved in cell wall biosynthesis
VEKQKFPLVSLIITSYNRASLINKAIESAIEQDYPNLEIIISDNCSTDNSDSVIRQYINDSRIKYNRNETNIGMLNNFRKTVYELASGDFITFVNSDDYLIDKSFVSDAIKLALKDSEIGIVFGKMALKNIISGVFWEIPSTSYFYKEIWNGKDVFFRSLETCILLSWGACMMKKKLMQEVNTFYAEYFNFDIESNCRIMLKGKVGFMNKLYYIQLGHDNNQGYPIDAYQVIQSMQCYKNVATYALNKMPSEALMIKKWEKYYLFFTVKMASHYLKAKSKKQYNLYIKGVKKEYPVEYKRFIKSASYFSLLLQPIKKMLPNKMIKFIRFFRRKFN